MRFFLCPQSIKIHLWCSSADQLNFLNSPFSFPLHTEPPMNPADEPSWPGSESPPTQVTQPMSDLSVFSPITDDQPMSGFIPIHSFPFSSGYPGSSSSSSSFIPQPLECLQLGSVAVPPFLSKTYDLVEEAALDVIISWGKHGESFVVWDPMEFAKLILPKNFKHNNFSSFVRQLNTYGFHKIDTDKWEFANEFFKKGKRHLLKNIQRRRSTSTHATTSSGFNESEKPGKIESEVERLKKERSSMLQEVIDLQQQQQGTVQYINEMGSKLQAAEQRQKKMVSFLAKLIQSPTFLARLNQKQEQDKQGTILTSPRTPRKFVKQRQLEIGPPVTQYPPDYLLEDFKSIPEQIKGKNVENYQPSEYDLVSFFPASSSDVKSFYQELYLPEIEDIVPIAQEENPWSVDASEIWDTNNNNNNVAAELDSDIWDDYLGHLQVEQPPVEDEFNNSLPRQLKDNYYYKKMDP